MSTLLILGGVVVLLLFAGAIVLHVLLAAPGKRPSVGETFAWSRGLLWAVPVLAVLAVFAMRVAPRFEEPAPSQAEVPEALQIEIDEPDGLNVELDELQKDAANDERGRIGKVRELAGRVKDKVKDAVSGQIKDPLGNIPEKLQAESENADWVSSGVTKDGDTTLVVLSSKEHATLADAERDVLAQAAARVRTDFEQRHPTNIDWTIPAEAIRFRESFDDTIQRRAGDVSFTMHKAYRQLELSDATREAAFVAFRDAVVEQRLWGVGAILGLATVIAAASGLYLRLDARTHGQYRTRLKAATVAALVAAGLLAASLA